MQELLVLKLEKFQIDILNVRFLVKRFQFDILNIIFCLKMDYLTQGEISSHLRQFLSPGQPYFSLLLNSFRISPEFLSRLKCRQDVSKIHFANLNFRDKNVIQHQCKWQQPFDNNQKKYRGYKLHWRQDYVRVYHLRIFILESNREYFLQFLILESFVFSYSYLR